MHNETFANYELISTTCRAMRKSNDLKSLYEKVVNGIHPGSSAGHIAAMEKITDRIPGGYPTAALQSGRTFRDYLPSVQAAPLERDFEKGDAEELENEMEWLAEDVMRYQNIGPEDESAEEDVDELAD